MFIHCYACIYVYNNKVCMFIVINVYTMITMYNIENFMFQCYTLLSLYIR